MFVNPVRVDIQRGNFSLCIDMHACLMGVCVLCILLLLLPLTAHSVIIYLVVQVTHYDESQLFIIMQLALIYSDKKRCATFRIFPGFLHCLLPSDYIVFALVFIFSTTFTQIFLIAMSCRKKNTINTLIVGKERTV